VAGAIEALAASSVALVRVLDIGTSVLATLTRAAQGLSVGSLGPRPEQPLVLFEFESCPFCRKVREGLTALDLEADVRPCPKGGHRYRDGVVERGGKAQFPYLVDPNTGAEMYESEAILDYLFGRYGEGPPPFLLRGALAAATGSVASGLRMGKGTRVEPSKPPAQPLELWSFEASPFCRIVREKLCTLELPYRLHNVGRESPSREAFVARSGKMQVPYLEDPNTQCAMFESADIVAYLDSTYGA
jgi:glutathione S-transferase